MACCLWRSGFKAGGVATGDDSETGVRDGHCYGVALW